MIGPAFVDTNLLVYARDASEPAKQQQARAWMAHLWGSRMGRLSAQVLEEFYVTVTQKLKPGMSREAARGDVRSLMSWRPVRVDGALLERGFSVQDRFGLSFWDALIVSGAQVARCRYVLSEDFQADQQMDEITVINPFVREPGSLG